MLLLFIITRSGAFLTVILQLASLPLKSLTVTHAVPGLTAMNSPCQLVFVILTISLLLERKVLAAEAVPEGRTALSLKLSPAPSVRVL